MFYRCLIGNYLHCLLHAGGITNVIMPDGLKLLVKLVDQWNSRGDVKIYNVGIRNVVEILDKGTEAIPVGRN